MKAEEVKRHGLTMAEYERILEKLGRDKKFDQGAIRFVLLRGLGDAFVSEAVTRDDIIEAVEVLRSVS